MSQASRGRVIMWSILAFAGFIIVAIIIPLWIRSARTSANINTAISAEDEQRNATKLAVEATAQAFPTAQIGVMEIKPLDEAETSQTPEATAFAPFSEGEQAGSGRIVEVQPPFPASLYRIENAWISDDPQAFERTFLWAGSFARQGEAEPGVVIIQVYRKGADELTPDTMVYPAPEGVGALKVTGAEGMRVTFKYDDDKTLIFDVAERRFLQE